MIICVDIIIIKIIEIFPLEYCLSATLLVLLNIGRMRLEILENIKGFFLTKNIEKKLKQYDIKLVHFVPGRVRLQSSRWINDVDLIERIIGELKSQPFVFSVQFTKITGSAVITYDANHVTDHNELQSWLQILNQVYTTEFLK